MDKKERIKELDIVALSGDISAQHLSKGAIGTIVHVYNNNFYKSNSLI